MLLDRERVSAGVPTPGGRYLKAQKPRMLRISAPVDCDNDADDIAIHG
jgi:hypothetical protein